MSLPERQIRAAWDTKTITVYQAFNHAIADVAVKTQTFGPPFKKERMTWIKPSFLWMMYRSGWATKDQNQNRILSVKITREGFEWALKHACLSHFDSSVYPSHDAWQDALAQSPVRIQWDPEKDLYLNDLPHRAIQIGLSGIAVDKYINEWIVSIGDITEYCTHIHTLLQEGKMEDAARLLPQENPYVLSDELHQVIHSSQVPVV
jgi:hypothetical protein